MSLLNDNTGLKPWATYEKILFRVAFIFFISMSVPTGDWYEKLFAIDWTCLHYRDLYLIARFLPDYRGNYFAGGTGGYSTMLFLFYLALGAGLIWSVADRKRPNYTVLYYWLRVIVRYRAAVYMMVWGMIKMFPVQMPYPSKGILNTKAGDLAMQKIYWWSVGIVPYYETFTGLVEFLIGLLLFFRRTTSLGAAMLVGTMGTLTIANIEYDGHVHVESTYFTICGLFLMGFYIRDVFNLLILRRKVLPRYYVHRFSQRWLRYTRLIIRAAVVIIFIIIMAYLSYINFRYDPYNQPITASPAELRGYYRVIEFSLNDKLIPYSQGHQTRWEDVTFEDWTTMSFKVSQPIVVNLPSEHGPIGFTFNSGAPMRDIDRNLESFTSGGRRTFHYYLDTLNKKLYLQDKAAGVKRWIYTGEDSVDRSTPLYSDNWISEEARKNIADEYHHVDKKAHTTRRFRAYQEKYPKDKTRNRMILSYKVVDKNHILLSGLNEDNKAIQVLLEKKEKRYILKKNNLPGGNYR